MYRDIILAELFHVEVALEHQAPSLLERKNSVQREVIQGLPHSADLE